MNGSWPAHLQISKASASGLDPEAVHDIVRAYLAGLFLTLSFFVVTVFAAEEFALTAIAILWYQLTGIAILFVITYRTFNQEITSSTAVGLLFLLWTGFLESLFVIHSTTGRLTVGQQDTVSGYAVALLNNILLLSQILLTLTISAVLFVIAIVFLRMVYTDINSPTAKAILYPVTFGIVFINVIGLALLAPVFPDTIPALSVATAVWLQSTLLAPLGIAGWFSAHFELTGLNYYLLWVILDLVVAWTFTAFDLGTTELPRFISSDD